MTEKEICLKVVEQSKKIAKAIHSGRDVEIVKTSSGITIKEVTKRKIS